MRSSENTPSRDCLETPDRIHFVVPRACGTRVKVSFSAPRASKRRAMQPVQLLSRQSLHVCRVKSAFVKGPKSTIPRRPVLILAPALEPLSLPLLPPPQLFDLPSQFVYLFF